MIEHLWLERERESSAIFEWPPSPYRPITWWDMHQFSLRMVFWSGLWLERLKEECLGEGSELGKQNFDGALLHRPISAELRLKAKTAVSEYLIETCNTIEMPISAETLSDFRERLLNDSKRIDYDTLLSEILNIQKIMEKEMKKKVFLYIPPAKTRFFTNQENPYPFGENVQKAFPSAYFDAFEAGACLATSRPTAAVFHLMRVLEIGLAALGTVFQVSLAHTNWAPAIEEIEKKIREMHKDPVWKLVPDVKEQQEFYAQAASHFGILKDAWRNHTMHVRGKYTEEEAERIHTNVKSFMQRLSEKLAEPKVI